MQGSRAAEQQSSRAVRSSEQCFFVPQRSQNEVPSETWKIHHALNNVFWFDTIGLGDLTHFWAGETSADVGWSLGIYMSGFFPCMMFGVPGAVLAMIHCARSTRRKAAAGILASAALCSFVCGITEPFEFSFMFASPGLYLVYALLYGIFTYVTALSGFRAGFSFSAGATDLLFSASLPAAAKTWMILPLGLAAFAVFYLTFRIVIRKFDSPVPGREEDEPAEGSEAEKEEDKTEGKERDKTKINEEDNKKGNKGESDGAAETGPEGMQTAEEEVVVEGVSISTLFRGLGGRENIRTVDNCATRLRLELEDTSLLDEKILKAAGARGVMKTGGNSAQVIIGLKVEAVADAMRERMQMQ